MKNSQLIKLLKTFTLKEIEKFSEYLSSPYFNKNKNISKLYNAIRKAYPDFEQEKLTKENLFGRVSPGRKYDDNKFRLLLHYLYENAKDFITYDRFGKEQNKYRFQEILINELIERELLDESLKILDKTIREFDKTAIKDSEYFLYKYVFENEKLYCIQRIKQEKYEKYMTKPSIETPLKNLINYFYNKVLTYYFVALNMKALFKLDIDTVLFEKIFSYFDYELFNDSPLIQMHYNIIMIFKTNDEKYYNKLKELVQKYEKSLMPMRLNDVYVNMENFCLRKIRAGETRFRHELHEILKMDLEKKIYKYESDMPQKLYKNIFHNAVDLKKFEWADNFIRTYKKELRSDHREATFCYCKAYLEAELNNFRGSLNYLAKLNTDELYLKIDVKLLQARLYYELDWYDNLNSAIDSMRHTFKENKFIADNRRAQYSAFIRFLSALNNARLKKDEYKIKELKESVQKAEDLQWKDWFIKKVEGLECTN